MSKTYADSVKLPNLVAVQHPSARLSPKNTLNIEGRNSSSVHSSAQLINTFSVDRRNYINSLIGKTQNLNKKKFLISKV